MKEIILKKGDWVINHVTPYIINEPFKITFIDEQGLMHGGLFIPKGKYKLWHPKENELVFMWNEGYPKCLVHYESGDIHDPLSIIKSSEIGYHGNSYWEYCEPFLRC